MGADAQQNQRPSRGPERTDAPSRRCRTVDVDGWPQDRANRGDSPHYFGTVSVPFAYDPKAPKAEKWLNFLNELWPNGLLSISGGDTITVPRKYREDYTGRLLARFHIISNELAKLDDASGAIVSRLVLLLTTESWYGRENHTLEEDIKTELASILNWALDGLHRLMVTNKGRFTRCAASEEAVQSMYDLASPVGAFVRDRCTIDPKAEVKVDDLYAAYKKWCDDNEQRKFNKAHFGTALKAAYSAIRKTRPREGDDRFHIYTGIRLGCAPAGEQQEKPGDDPLADEAAAADATTTGDPLADEAAAARTTTGGHVILDYEPWGVVCQHCGSEKGVVHRIRMNGCDRTASLHEGCASAFFSSENA